MFVIFSVCFILLFRFELNPVGLAPDGDLHGPRQGFAVESLGQLALELGMLVRGIFRAGPHPEIPVVVSEAFLEGTGLEVGDALVARVFRRFLPLEIVASVRLFPTLAPGGGGFAIADVKAVLEYLDLRGPVATGASAEAFLSLEETAYGDSLPEIRRIATTNATLEDRRSLEALSLVNPLAVAGWRGVTWIAIGVSVVIALAGLATYLLVQLRGARPDWAVLRALGFTRGSFSKMAAVEHLSAAVLGAGAGTLAGLVTSRLIVAAMSETETGKDPLPPFVLVTQWAPVWLVYAAAATAAVLVLAAAYQAVGRLQLRNIGDRAA